MSSHALSQYPIEALPVAPGLSSFQVKGVAYRGLVEFLKGRDDGLWQGVLGGLDGALAEFCSQPFMAASWYDALPMRPLTFAVARQLGMPYRVYLRGGGARQAAGDARTVYRHLITSDLPPFEVLRKQIDVGLRYYSFLTGECISLEGTAGQLNVQGMPRYLAPWFVEVQEAYTTESLKISGALAPVVKAEVQEPVRPWPLEPTTIVFRVTWRQ